MILLLFVREAQQENLLRDKKNPAGSAARQHPWSTALTGLWAACKKTFAIDFKFPPPLGVAPAASQ